METSKWDWWTLERLIEIWSQNEEFEEQESSESITEGTELKAFSN